jgi:hypothetical protein
VTIRAVMLGLEARLETIPGLQASGVKPELIAPPAAIVGVPPVEDYQEAYARTKYTLRPTITVLTSTALDRAGQLALADYVSLSGRLSIPAAIHADPTLGGVAEAAELVSFRPLSMEDIGRISYYGGLFILRVLVRESL